MKKKNVLHVSHENRQRYHVAFVADLLNAEILALGCQ